MPQWVAYILFFICFVLLIIMTICWWWGVISPSSFNKFAETKAKTKAKPITRKSAFWGFGSLGLLFFVLSGITGNWATGPTVDLTGFKDDRAVTDSASYEINGSTFDKNAKVTVDGRQVALDSDGKFHTILPVHEGDNTFLIVIMSAKGDRTNTTNVIVHRRTAVEIAAAQPHPTPAASKTPSSTPKPSPSSSPNPSPSPTITHTPTPTSTPKPATPKPTTPQPTVVQQPSVYYANCTAVRAAGAAPIYRGQPGYRPELDRDNDGIACETN